MRTILDVEEEIRDQFGNPVKVSGKAYCGKVRLIWTLYLGGYRACIDISGPINIYPRHFLSYGLTFRHYKNREIFSSILSICMLALSKEIKYKNQKLI